MGAAVGGERVGYNAVNVPPDRTVEALEGIVQADNGSAADGTTASVDCLGVPDTARCSHGYLGRVGHGDYGVLVEDKAVDDDDYSHASAPHDTALSCVPLCRFSRPAGMTLAVLRVHRVP